MNRLWLHTLGLAAGVSLAVVAVPATASAGSIVITDAQFSQYNVATSDTNGFFVGPSDSGSGGAGHSQAYGMQLWAGYDIGDGYDGYSDAGIVLFFDGGLALGELGSVSANRASYDPGTAPLAINLWLDTGGDGTFFAFGGTGILSGLDGDSYGGHAGPVLSLASPIYPLGGISTGNLTLADLQAGLVSGIDADTRVALWIGITRASGDDTLYAALSDVTVTTIPDGGATLALLGLAMVGLGALRQRRS